MTTPTVTRLWLTSVRFEQSGFPRLAKIVKAVNFYLNHTLLSSQVVVDPSVRVEHHGLGVVIHPNTTIGPDVIIWHNVTIAAETKPGSPHRVVVGSGVVLGAGCTIVARSDQGLHIGDGARIGAGAVVTGDVAPNTTVVGVPARFKI